MSYNGWMSPLCRKARPTENRSERDMNNTFDLFFKLFTHRRLPDFHRHPWLLDMEWLVMNAYL
jgi:hypothetical protein